MIVRQKKIHSSQLVEVNVIGFAEENDCLSYFSCPAAKAQLSSKR